MEGCNCLLLGNYRPFTLTTLHSITFKNSKNNYEWRAVCCLEKRECFLVCYVLYIWTNSSHSYYTMFVSLPWGKTLYCLWHDQTGLLKVPLLQFFYNSLAICYYSLHLKPWRENWHCCHLGAAPVATWSDLLEAWIWWILMHLWTVIARSDWSRIEINIVLMDLQSVVCISTACIMEPV